MVWGGVIYAFYDWITGHSWTHIWYLYMLIGLYLLTPIIKPFLIGASKEMIAFALLVVGIICSVLPTIESFGIDMGGWMKSQNPYILLYMMGFFLMYGGENRLGKKSYALIGAFSVAVLMYDVYRGIDSVPYYSIFVIFLAVSIFQLAKLFQWKSATADKLGPYCFGIYLVHPFFLNVVYKMMHINLADYGMPWVTIVLFAALIFALSLALTYMLRLIPPFRKYVL